ALHGISARVEPGAVILLRGPSGSGKSTLLRCLNGLVPHSTGGAFSGRVIVCGLDTQTQLPRELGTRIGFVFQHPDAQFVLEDVEAELAFGLENLGLGRSLMRKRIEEVIDQVGIHALRRRRIGTLSGGERQRVAIAAALAMHPQALALDEPTSQLDPQAAEDVLQVVLRLVAELGMTTVIAEHRVERIAPFVDRIWTLEAGRLQDQEPGAAVAGGGARPPVVDLALRAGWTPIPLGLRDARVRAQSLPPAAPESSPANGPGPVIAHLHRLAYAYPGARAVDDVSLTLRRGQVPALMGRNGAGRAVLLLLDEPTRGLDPMVKKVLTGFLRMRASAGTAMLIATHDVEWAARTADRVLLMADGEIYADGPPRTVLSDSLVFATQINKLLGRG